MSNFRDRAAAIKAEGAERRGEFIPDGAPKRLYNFWLSNSDSRKAWDIRHGSRKENFCHFWRVVAIWAPLLFLGKKIEKAARSDYAPPVAVGFVIVFLVAFALMVDGLPGLGFLVAIVAALAAMTAVAACIGYLLETYPNAALKFAKALSVVAVVMAVGALLVFTGLYGLAILVLGGILFLVVKANIGHIADWIEGMRARAERKREEERRARRERALAFYDEHGYWPHEAPAKEPGKISNFFRAVGDFIIMAAEVVRVNKWKICPLVELDTTQKTEDDWGYSPS